MDNQTIVKLKSWACNSDIQLAHDVLSLIASHESVKQEYDECKQDAVKLHQERDELTNEVNEASDEINQLKREQAEQSEMIQEQHDLIKSLQQDKAALIDGLTQMSESYDKWFVGANPMQEFARTIVARMKGETQDEQDKHSTPNN